MGDDRQILPDAAESSTNRVVRRLSWRYLFVLMAVAVLVIVDQAIVQPLLIQVNAFAPAINVAGRQRMISQKLTKVSLVIRNAENATSRRQRLDELRQSLAQWSAEHDALVEGDAQLGIRPIRTPELDAEWARLEPHYRAMVAAASDLGRFADVAEAESKIDSAVAAIVEHEAQFLPTMDRIVKLMEEEAARAVGRLRAFALAISAAIFLLLVGLGWFVVRPATCTIRAQVDALESRVAQRTSELSAALQSLQHEARERELAERRNQGLSAQLTHAERVSTMGHLTAGLAHELNQPLGAIANYTEACDVLLNEAPAEINAAQVRGFVVQARQAALRAGQIVRRMRNFVRPNATVTAAVRINASIAEIVELCRNEAKLAGTEISLALEAQDDLVSADPIQIQQVLVNLIQNSIQAMRDAECSSRRIEIHTATVGAFIQIDVRDTGPGFGSADADTLFEPFHSTKQDGLGIGLSICRSIVENHQGRIWAEPIHGPGAQVSFTLPLSVTHADFARKQPDCLCC